MRETIRPTAPIRVSSNLSLSISDVHCDLYDQVLCKHPDKYETDDDGQLILHTGIYRWKDGSYHYKPEPKQKSEPKKRTRKAK